MSFVDWWSIVSTLLSVVLGGLTIWSYVDGRSQKEKTKAQVKVWMEGANGVSEALKKIVGDNLQGRYSSTNDVCNAVWAVQSSSFALYQSLYEERCLTEEEYKDRQKKIWQKIESNQLLNASSNSSANAPVVSPVQITSTGER